MEDVTGHLATLDDVDALCDICREGFPGTLLWDGPRFLARGWWKDVLRSSLAETWVWSRPRPPVKPVLLRPYDEWLRAERRTQGG